MNAYQYDLVDQSLRTLKGCWLLVDGLADAVRLGGMPSDKDVLPSASSCIVDHIRNVCDKLEAVLQIDESKKSEAPHLTA